MNLVHSIELAAARHPDKPAVVVDGAGVSYASWLRKVASVASALQAAGVAQGDCVGLALANPAGYLTAAVALARIGAISSVFRTGWDAAFQRTIARRHGLKCVVLDDPSRAGALQADSIKVIAAQDIFRDAAGGGAGAAPAVAAADALPWTYVLSSGTTGSPRSIVRTHQSTAEALRIRDHYAPDARVMLFNDMSMIWMMHTALQVLSDGATLVLCTRTAANDILNAIEAYKATHLVTSTDAAQKLAWYKQQHPAGVTPRFSALQVLSVTGGSVSASNLERMQAQFTGNVWVGYVSSEAGVAAIARHGEGQASPGQDHCGKILPEVQMQALAATGEVLPAGATGTLRIKSPGLCAGYLTDEGRLQPFDDGWFYPGDVGAVDADGYLRLAGRNDHILNLGGRKLNPERIEAALEQHPDIKECAVTQLALREGGIEVLVAVVVSDVDISTDMAKSFLLGKVTSEEMPEFVTRMHHLPRNSMGKLMREHLTASLRLEKTPA